MVASTEKSPQKIINVPPALKPIVAGGVTGVIESIFTYPTEYVKTTLQMQKKGGGSNGGMWGCVRQTVNEHGFLGLYRGMTPILVGSIPKQGSRWGAFETASTQMKTINAWRNDISDIENVVLSPLEVALCGTTAGSVEALVAVVPTETVKTQLIADQHSANPKCRGLGFAASIRLLVRENGLQSTFYRGASSTVMKQGLNQTVRFPAQQFIMTTLFGSATTHPERKKSPLFNGIAGFGAGLFSVVVTQPVDVVKTRMQQGWTLPGDSSRRFLTPKCAAHIAKTEGLRTFYQGSIPRMARVGANVALTFTIFPIVRQLF